MYTFQKKYKLAINSTIMKLIDIKEYNGFKTEFFLLPKTESFLREQGINIKDRLMDNFHWYEHVVFGLLDPELDKNWSAEKETRKNFKVVFYGIIEKVVDKNSSGFVEDFTFDEENVLSDNQLSIHLKNKSPFAIREKILIV